jgi:hypothetical protein
MLKIAKMFRACFTQVFIFSLLCAIAPILQAQNSPAPRVTDPNHFIPPATPLIACDPYFSIWSQGDKLTDVETTHWTGKPHRIGSLIRIDDKTFRLMGASPTNVPALRQSSVEVWPTRTIYQFSGAGVGVTLTFLTPALPDDIDILSRPVTYLLYDLQSTDGKTHTAQIYFDASAELTVNTPDQTVSWTGETIGNLAAVKMGSTDQMVLAKKGDDLRIDWGYFYAAAPNNSVETRAFANRGSLQSSFVQNGLRMVAGSLSSPSAARDVAAAIILKPAQVGTKAVSRWLMVVYDDLYSIQYMHKDLRPFWRRNGWDAAKLLNASARELPALQKRCVAFDQELVADLRDAGGEKYAKIGALAYRQCFAAGKFVADENGQPLHFCKENHSNGCIATSDVFYPMAPQFLLLNPSLAKAFIAPFMQYAISDRWKFPFAPHDLGTYPKANGQVYGGGERTEENQMPVEESGNLLLLLAAVAEIEGNANFASLYWRRLVQWAEYLKSKGFDPENQLCTDDFAGHLAHNVNLSAKAICGLGAFAKLCEMRGDKQMADSYMQLARGFAERWVKEADDGDHFKLAFDRPGTWSQKYNLIWDRILGLNLFPLSVARKEMDFYRKTQNRYGLPLDNRETYTKLDWILWTATLTQDRNDFESLVAPVYLFLQETPNRSPMTDWYQTKTAKKVGFTARPVVGGVFAELLYNKDLVHKYASRDKTKAAKWAAMPVYTPPVPLIPTARENRDIEWHYTTERPADTWYATNFDASGWRVGKAGFGTRGTPGSVIGTEWNSSDIWIRREVNLTSIPPNITLTAHHDEDMEVYINGVRAASVNGFSSEYEDLPLSAPAKAALHPGSNIIAVHCHQTRGGQYIDLGLSKAAR